MLLCIQLSFLLVFATPLVEADRNMAESGRELVVFKNARIHFERCFSIPPNGQKFSMKIKIRFHLIIIFFSLPAIIGNCLYLWRVLTKDEVPLQSLLECLHVIGEFMAATVTGSAAVLYGHRVWEFFYHLGVHEISEPDNLAEVYEKHDKISRNIVVFAQFSAIARIILNYYKNSFCEAKEKYHDERYLCGMIIPCWFPFHLNIATKTWIFLSFNLIFGTYIPVAALSFFVVDGVSDLIVLRMKKMKYMLQKVDFRGNKERIKKQLIYCIEFHSEIWNLVRLMNYSIGMTHLSQYALISGVIALVEYELIVSSNLITGISQLLILIIGEFMVCSAGQKLEDEREAMAESLYLTPWYQLPIELRSTFAIFLAKMQMPLHFEAKPIIHLNYEFLMKVLKGSYTFLMFLQKKSP